MSYFGPYGEVVFAATESLPLPGTPPEVYRLFLLRPEVVFSARVNQTVFSYPLDSVTYDGATGDYEDVEVGQTIFFGSTPGGFDRGSQRVRALATSSVLNIGRSSRGVRPGEVDLDDDVYITVLDLREVWARPPYIAPDGTISKDPGLAVEWRTTTPPPVANTGPGFCRTIDPDTGTISVALPPGANTSFATSDGATITTYLWDVKDGTIVVGTSADDTIVATFPPGFRYVSLTVTDDEGHSHTAYCPIFARDPDEDATVPFQFERHTIRADGQELAVRILADIPAADYPPGTLAMIWRGEPQNLFDRSHMVIIGWLGDIPAQIEAQRTGTLRDATLNLLDVAGRLDALPGFTQRVEDDSLRDPTAFPAITWMHYVNLTMDKYLHYLLAWHSTALGLADFEWTGTGETYAATGLESGGGTLWEQIASQAAKLRPDWALECNPQGQLRLLPDPMVRDVDDRTATVQADLTASDWSDIRYEHRRHPRVYWLRSGAVRSGRTTPISTVFCVAPGDAPGQGGVEQTQNEGLVESQAILNATEGHRYARLNAAQSEFRLTLAGGDGHGITPTHAAWVTLTLPAALAAQRGLSFTERRGLVKEIDIRYSHERGGLVRSVELVWEAETVGLPASTHIPAAGEVPGDDTTWPGDYWGSPPPPPPPPPPDEPFYDPVQAYLLWDGAHVYYTPDILAMGGPTWEFADDGLSGNIYDCQYVVNSSTTVGIWLMASTGIWFCDDIFTSPRNWVNVLPIATIQAAEDTPETGEIVCQCMANYASEPGYLCVAVGPNATSDAANNSYEHTPFWHTHDYGDTWTRVDAYYLYREGAGPRRGFCRSSVQAMEIFRSAPGYIFCVRSTPNYVLSYGRQVLKSDDLGHTWTETFHPVLGGLNNRVSYSLLHPFPTLSDASYVVSGPTGASDQPDLQRSNNQWTSAVQLTDNGTPTGYGGICSVWRVNKISDDPNHVLGWFRHSASGTWHLLESNDQGATWSLLYESGIATVSVPNLPIPVSVNSPAYVTPNGWAGDSVAGNTWFLVKANHPTAGTAVAGAILMTQDRFATAPVDLAGNLASLVGANGWTPGPCGGISLAKVGPNV